MPDPSSNVARFLTHAAHSTPHALAVKAPTGKPRDGTISYTVKTFAELEGESAATARILSARGLKRGSLTLLLVKPGLNLIRITFALFKIGAVPVVIDPGMGLRNFLACVKHTRPEFLVGIPAAWVLRHAFRSTFSSVRASLTINRRYEKALVTTASVPYPTLPAAASERAAILFTSGSTGAPKGVCYTHGIFDAQVRLIRETYGIQPGEVDLPMLPIFALFNPALGMTTVVPEMNPSRPASVDPANIVQAIRQNAVTNSFGSPVLWTRIGRYCTQQGIHLPSLRRILVAGAPVSPALIRTLLPLMPNGTLHTPYGATEALPVSTLNGREILEKTWQHTENGAGTCVGRALKDIQTRIIAISDGPLPPLQQLAEVPAGTIGEIAVSGPVVTASYHALPAATAAAKITAADGSHWHRMGDLGYVDNKGRLWFCGRKAERVQAHGRIFYTDCCEAVFNRHEGVFRTALIGAAHNEGTHPVLMVEPETGEFPRTAKQKQAFAKALYALGQAHTHTRAIHTFAFNRAFPVDVRHNAKIHRLTLARRFRWKHAVKVESGRLSL